MSGLASLVCVKDFEREAEKVLPRGPLGYYQSGATTELTLRENEEAFSRYYIRPRALVDVSKCDLSTSVLGYHVKLPIGVAPTAMQRMAHPEGECANARAAARMGSLFTLSTISTSSIEEVAAEGGLRFFQLYIYKDRNVTAELVRRAERSGYKALVLTVDAPTFGIRYADIRNKFSLPPHLRMANFESGDDKSVAVNKSKGGSAINEYVASLFDQSLTWKDVSWLKSITRLPIVLKGILRPEDAVKGVEAGVAAIWVSNHGARQVDGVLPTIEALPEVVDAVGDRCEVYVDGGFRSGSDVLKALALGARMVFMGRPLIWGLACGGSEGVLKVLNIMQDELRSALMLSGFTSVEGVTRSSIVRGITSRL